MSNKITAGGFHLHNIADDIGNDRGQLGVGPDGSFFQPSQPVVLHNLNDVIAQQAALTGGLLSPDAGNTAPHIGATSTTAGVVSVVRADLSATGAQSLQDNSFGYSIFSPDGTKVLFFAGDLGAGGSGGLFAKDLATGSLTLLSTDANGANIGGFGSVGGYSPDQTKLAFSFNNTTLNGNNSNTQVFIKNLATGAVTDASTSAAGVQATGQSTFGSFSPDGTKVAFSSFAGNLVTNVASFSFEVYVKDLTTGAITDVSLAGIHGSQAYGGWFSPDGTSVAFASNFGYPSVPGVPVQTQEVYLENLTTGALTLVSGFSNGLVANGASDFDGFSADGTKVLFETAATNLPPGSGWNAYVKDLTTGAITLAASNITAPFQNSGQGEARFSPDSSKIIYSAVTSSQLGGSDASTQIFEKDLNTGTISLMSVTGLGGVGDGISSRPSLSADGSKIVYDSRADNLAVGDVNQTGDIFVANLGYVAKAAPVALAAGLTLSDADSANLAGATVTISAGFQSGDTLSAATAGTAITAAYNAATHVLTLSGSDTLAHYQGVLRGVAFSNATNNDPAAAPTRTISWQIDDGNSVNHASNVSTTTINVVDAATGTHTGGVTITGTLVEGHTLTADTSTLADPNGLGTLHYIWQSNADGDPTVVGGDQPTYTLSSADVGGTVTVTVGYLDGHGNAESVTNDSIPITGVNHTPTGTDVLTGTFATGSVLTADLSNVTDVDGFPDSGFEYLWLRKINGHTTIIQDGASASYTVTAADAGSRVSVEALYTDNRQAPEAVILSTDTLNVPNHLATGGVTISGNTAPGQTLTADTSSLADADGLGAVSYVWERSFFGFANQVIVGTNAPTYVLTNADANDVIRVYIHFTDGHGNVESLVSAITSQVVAPPDSIPVPVVGNTGNEVFYTEHGTPVVIDPDLTISDAKSATLTGATVAASVSGDTLNFVNQNGITGSFAVDQFGDGTLTLTGTASLAAYQAALRSVTFSSTSDDPTVHGTKPAHAINWQVNDGAASNATNFNAVSTVAITAVNSAPVFIGSAGESFTEGAFVPEIFSQSSQATDADGATLVGATVTIAGGFVAGDVLGVNILNGGITANYNTATHVLTLSGTASLADYTATLRSVTFNTPSDDPTAGGTSPTRSIAVQLDDGASVNHLSAVATISLSVFGANDAPVIGGVGNTTAYTILGPGVVIDGALTITDPDSANLVGATVRVGTASSTDILSFTNQNGITGTYDAAHVLTLTGSASVAAYQAALRSVTYSSTSANPAQTIPTRPIFWTVDDGATDNHASATVTSTITYAGVNVAPVLGGGGNNVHFTEAGTPVAIDPGLTVSDIDSANLTGATVTISGLYFAGDMLAFANQNGITGSYNAGSHALTLTGTASLANYQAALRSVTYFSTSNNPDNYFSNQGRYIDFAVDDGGSANHASNTVTTLVSITPVNSPPVLGGGGTSINYHAHDAAAVIDSNLTVSDVDSFFIVPITATISSGYLAGDVLDLTGSLSFFSHSYDATTHTLTIDAPSQLADAQTLLRSITFSSTSDNPDNSGTDPTRTISFTVHDNALANTLSNTVTATVNVSSNFAPTLGGAGNTVGYTEQAAGVALDSALTLTDSDSANLAGATVTISGGFVAGDLLNFTNQNGISGSYDAASHKLTLSGAASVANYQAALRSVTFSSPSDNPDNFGASPTRTITWGADDGAGLHHASNSVTTSVTVTAVDDLPAVHNDAFAANEEFGLGSGLNVFADNGAGADSDPDSHTLAVTAVNGVTASVGQQITLASGALLTLNANGTFFYDSNGAFEALAAPASGATNTSATDSFHYTINGTVETATVTITGVDNNDVVHTTSGNDTIDGGIGRDVLVFTGNQADYSYVYNTTTHAYTVTDLRGGSPDGTDTVRNFETFRFANGDFDVSIASTITGNAAGGTTTTSYDASGAYAWASQVSDTDAQNSLASQSVVTDGGTRWLNTYDTTGAQSWLWTTSTFDAGGHQLQQVVTNDDGTHTLTLFDAANQYAWTSATLAFDANWNQTGLTGTNDNGSHTITMANIGGALDLALWFTTPYDANQGAAIAVPLNGGGNADILYGHAGNDAINGGGGNDLIVGGAGNDQLTGGTGDDHFVFAFGDGLDTITDFTPGNASGDVIDLHGYGVASFTALQAFMSQSGSDTLIAFDAQNHITLHNVTLGQLNAGDFLFS